MRSLQETRWPTWCQRVFLLCALAASLPAAGVELYEDFHNAPSLSEGWTYGVTNNVELGFYDSESSVDDKTSLGDVLKSLKISKGKKSDDVVAEVLSPVSTDALRQYSFFCKSNGSGENGDCISVYGRADEASEWQMLTAFRVENFKKHWETNGIAEFANVRQLKFTVAAPAESYKALSLDSLCVSTETSLPQGGDDPTEPTKPTNVKLEATASDRIQATWEGVPGENGYRVEMFQVEDMREIDTPDFSGVGSAVWPDEWTHSDSSGFGWYSSEKLIKVSTRVSWFASRYYPKPITRFEYKFKSNKGSPEVRNTELIVSISKTESDDDWIEFDRLQVSGSMSNVVGVIDAGEGVRRLKFAVGYQGSDMEYAGNLLLGVNVLSIVCGESSAVLVADAEPSGPTVVFSNLNATASYFATVAPNPANDPGLVATSAVLDLSKEHFRRTGAMLVSAMRHGYVERFDSLSNFVSKTKTAKMDLDYWQFVLNGADMDALGVSQTNSASSTAGCYVCRDKEKISSLDSSMIGTLASGEKECAVGLAIANDSGTALQNLKVTFDSVQRSSYANSATYAFEWRISDSETSIAAGSDWNQVGIPQTAPVTSAGRSVMAECRQCDIAAAIPAKLPMGKVLLIRWRHPATTSGPMMAIDNVRIAFDKSGGFLLLIR